MFENTIYLRIYKNRVIIRHIESKHQIVIHPEESFTTDRLIVGNFHKAEKAIKVGIKRIYQKKWLQFSPKILIQQLEMNEGGLSEVEERILKEIAASVGARSCVVWNGHELTDSEVIEKIKNI